MPHYFEIFVENPTLVKTTAGYEQIKVYRSDTYDGTYTALNTVLTLNTTQNLYPYLDGTGSPTSWYKYTYLDTDVPVNESGAYGPYLGGTPLYCRIADLKTRLNDGVNSADDLVFYQNVRAATDFVRRYCRRHFEWKAEARYFQGPSFKGQFTGRELQTLFLDDVISISDIKLDYSGGRPGASLTTFVLGRDVFLSPLEAPTLDEPYTSLDFVPGANVAISGLTTGQYNEGFSMGAYWPRGYHAITITGVWGWPIQPLTASPVPADVQEATLQLASRLYKGKDNAYSRVTGNSQLGQMNVMDALLNADTKTLLAPYRKMLSY